jgi:hypothetical protein
MASLQQNALVGDDLERAFYYPEDQDFLLEFEPKVHHYEIMASF